MRKFRIHQMTPAGVAVALLLCIFVAELIIMSALRHLTDLHEGAWWLEPLLDAALLTLVVSLFVGFALIRPLQNALRSEREKSRVVFDNAAEGIVTIDEHGAIQAFNRAAERLFGFTAAEAVGRNVSIIVPSPDRERHDAYLKRYRQTGEGRVVNRTRQVLAQRRDGTVFPVEMSMSEVRLRDARLFTAIIRDITERRKAEERIRQLAYHDALTELPNRTLYRDRLAQALALASREQRKVGLLLLDLDGFKPINDMHGHHAGDRVLREVAIRLLALVRESDTVARLGGDEFSIVLSSITDRAGAEETARRVNAVIDQPYVLAEARVSLGVSVGIAVFPDDGSDADKLGRIADERMYETKARRKAAWANDIDAPSYMSGP